MVKFIYKDAALEYDPDSNQFKHPQTGGMVPTVMHCLAGWSEPDKEKRQMWGGLTSLIREMFKHVDPAEFKEAEEINFTEQG